MFDFELQEQIKSVKVIFIYITLLVIVFFYCLFKSDKYLLIKHKCWINILNLDYWNILWSQSSWLRGHIQSLIICQTGPLRFHDDVTPLQFLFTLVVMAVTARPSFLIHEGHGLGTDEPKLISQSVHLQEVPTKVIKVTKTVAIKVPVPYPVKVSNFPRKRKLINWVN